MSLENDGILWDFDMLNTDCLETWQDLSLRPSASKTASKCPGSLGGVRVKNHCVGLRPALPLKFSFRKPTGST